MTPFTTSSSAASPKPWPPSASATPPSPPPRSAPSPPPKSSTSSSPRSSIARAAGGKILTGGSRLTTNGLASGNYFQPTVIAGVSRNSPICKAEIFGPVALLFRITSLEEAIALANDTPFGLAASAWTSDPHEQQRLAAELQCGAVFFNQTVASDPRLPFGGIKRSGYGRELSAAGMREFLNAKTVVVAQTSAIQQPQPAERTRTELPLKLLSREGPPSEFSHFADQIRKFEPRKPQTEESRLDLRKSHLEDREPKPKSESKSEPRRLDLDTRKRDPRPLPSGLKPIVFETKPDPIKMAPIVWDAKPDERKLAPIVWDNQPEERRLAPIVNGSKLDERKLAPTVIDSAPQQVSQAIPARAHRLRLNPRTPPHGPHRLRLRARTPQDAQTHLWQRRRQGRRQALSPRLHPRPLTKSTQL